MTLPEWVTVMLAVIEYTIKVVAIGVVPENRRPSSSQAWLLLILFVPVVGLPLFLLIGSPYLTGRRHRLQAEANNQILSRTQNYPLLPAGAETESGLAGVIRLNRNLGALPCVQGTSKALYPDYRSSIDAMTQAVSQAQREINVEIYIIAWDETTDGFFTALAAAVGRGVTVRLLFDHIGTRGYPGYGELKRRLTAAGIDWHPMLPILPLKRRWRRPDLRNHRKLMVVDDELAFMGSQNMIDSSYLKRRHVRAGRHWKDLNIAVTGEIVHSLNAVFALDWYTETGEHVETLTGKVNPSTAEAGDTAFQLLPSGPGFATEPNLRMFNALIYRARHTLSITSPYFVPDESLLMAITSAAYRGVHVELFVSEQADQFLVQHAQRSYYHELLSAGVRIWLYPAPTVLHAKHLTIDEDVAVIGSSNLDMRSFGLDYEISLMGLGPDFTGSIKRIEDGYRSVCSELTLAEWEARPRLMRWIDNVARLTSALQ